MDPNSGAICIGAIPCYTLAPDVYLVRGYKRHCLYDLDKGSLYNISDETRQIIEKIIINKNALAQLNSTEKPVAEKLISAELLIPATELQQLRDIRELARASIPIFAWIEVTKACNLRCIFCYEEASACRYENMSPGDFSSVKNALSEIGVKKIQFIGGEPLVIGDALKNMIISCRDDFSFIEVYSNGTLIDEEWCEFFKKHEVSLALSIHSYVAKQHDRVTLTKGSHAKVNQAIRLLHKYEIPFRVAAVRTKGCTLGNKPEGELYKIRTDNVRLTGRGKFFQYSFAMFKEKVITKEKMQSRLNKNRIMNNVSGHKCFAKNLYIDTSLQVFPCVMERRFTHGNLRDHKLKDILDENICALSKDKINVCKNCEYRYNCYDCRPDSNGEDKLAKPWYCSYNPYTAEWLDPTAVFQILKKNGSVTK